MQGTVTDALFDSIVQDRGEFKLLFRAYSDAASEFIGPLSSSNRFAKLNGKPDRRSDSVHAVSIAHTLNAMYLDALLAGKTVQTCLGRAIEVSGRVGGNAKTPNRSSKKGRAADDNSIQAFVIHSIRACARQLAEEFPTDEEYSPECGILCCGVLAGLGLLLNSALQSNPRESKLSRAEIRELRRVIDEILNLDDRFDDIVDYLDDWIREHWKAQEYRSSFGQIMGANSDFASHIFWTTQLFHLYQSVTYLLCVAQASELPMGDLSLGGEEKRAEVAELAAGAGSVAEAYVMAWVVGLHSGLVQSPSRDILYWLIIYLMNSSKLECEDICSYVLKIIFDKFFVNGCFSFAGGETAAIANLSHSSEILSILLYCDLFRRTVVGRERMFRQSGGEDVEVPFSIGSLAPSVLAEHYKQIASHLLSLKTVQERRLWSRGMGVQAVDHHIWRICLISCGILLAEDILDRYARQFLGVQQFVDLPKIDYPEELKFIESHIIDLIRKGGEARSEASYSMILYGPPGTAKTTIAKKIAQDLGWPFLEIGSRDFLRDGSDKIDAQADRIFYHCSYLRDVVILFDELEELIRDREVELDKQSRLLTTSMLPRIQELRDQKSAVFIFATNRLKTLDLAATRLGRFDIIKYLGYPSTADKIKILNDAKAKAGDRYPVLSEALAMLAGDSPRLEKLTKNMAYKEVDYYLKQARGWAIARGRSKNQARARELAKKIAKRFEEHKRNSFEYGEVSKHERAPVSEPDLLDPVHADARRRRRQSASQVGKALGG
jgi:AAA+ superfamily predicted ATPase